MSTAAASRPATCARTSPPRAARRSIYERLINITDDPGIKEALGFLMTREIAHQKSFEKALYSIEDNFPSGKLPGISKFANLYVNTSQGEGDVDGPWNTGEQWERIDDLDETLPIDGGDGTATVTLPDGEMTAVDQMASRLQSQLSSDPTTGADLGAGEGAGKITDEDKGGASDMAEAIELAKSK